MGGVGSLGLELLLLFVLEPRGLLYLREGGLSSRVVLDVFNEGNVVLLLDAN